MKDLSNYSEIELMTLLAGKKQQSEQAFREIYNRYSRRIYAYVYKILENKENTQDIFQETFVNFYETYRKQKTLDNILGLLLKISRNLCLNYKRNEKNQIEFNEEINSEIMLKNENFEVSTLIENSLRIIDNESREIFVLRLYEGLSYLEISELMGINISSARTKFQRAKDKIKDFLSPFLSEQYK